MAPEPTPTIPPAIPPTPPTATTTSPKKLLGILLLVLLLPAAILAVKGRNLLATRAAGSKLGSVQISPGEIRAASASASNPYYLSAQAFAPNGSMIATGVEYVWGISTIESPGNLIPDLTNTKLAKFVPSGKPGQGDIYVRAILGGREVRHSIPLLIGAATVTPTPMLSPSPTSRTRPQ